MKPLKMFGLAGLTALLAMAPVGASSAMAEGTALCGVDEIPCDAVAHVHETTLSGHPAELLSGLGTVTCDVLYLGDTVEGTGEPLEISGEFTYSNCELGGSCTAKEENGPAEIKVLKEGHEKAKVTGEYLVHFVCGKALDCSYIGTGLVGTFKGPLLATHENGEVTISEQSLTKETGGFLCPKTAKLDITTTPLEATFLVAGLHYCVENVISPVIGFYADANCTERATARVKPYELVVAGPNFSVKEVLCVHKSALVGYWFASTVGICEGFNVNGGLLFEKGKITKVK